MLQTSHLLNESDDWDTNWARKFLKIPQDQLDKLNNISEWSSCQILTTEKTVRKEDHIVTVERESLLQSACVLEKLTQSNSTASNFKNLRVSNLLQFTENKLTRSASLNFLNLFDKSSEQFKLRSSSSAPNIKELLLSSNDLASEEQCAISITSPQKSKIPELLKLNPSEGKVKDTVSVPTKFNQMESFSQPIMDHKMSSTVTKPLKKLSDSILNHKYLKGSVNSTRQSQELEQSKMPIKDGNKQNLIDKLMLLEKRFSPAKKFVSPTKEYTKQDDDLGNTNRQELSKPIFQAPKDTELEVQDNVSNEGSSPCDIVDEDNVQAGTSDVQNAVQESGANVIQGKMKEADPSNYEHGQFVSLSEPAKNESSVMGINHEETFGSQLPCGQPLPEECNPCLQPNASKKANIETHDKPKSAGDTSGNIDVQNSPRGGGRSSGTKRKRKSKIETPKKAKHSIHFTADQVRNMLEMIKMLHSET